MFVYAKLTEKQLDRVRALERAKGLRLVAFSDVDISAAPLDSKTLGEIQKVENDLGVCLLAVN